MADPRTLAPSECTLEAWKTRLVETHPELRGDLLDRALLLLSVHADREQWYSEDAPRAKADDVEQSLAAWEELRAVLEPAIPHMAPLYEYAWHPLTALMASARMIWLWFEMRAVGPLLERTASTAESKMTPTALWLVPANEMNGSHERGSGLYLNAQYPHLHWFFLGEIAEASDDPARALPYFERFLRKEPDFAPLCDFALDEYFYYLRRYLPSSIDAYRRAGLAAEALDRDELAEALYRKAFTRRHTHQTPFIELAALCRKQGRLEEAARLELERAETLAHGYTRLRKAFDLPHVFTGIAQRFTDLDDSAMARHCERRADEVRRTY